MVIKALALATGYYGLDMDMAVCLLPAPCFYICRLSSSTVDRAIDDSAATTVSVAKIAGRVFGDKNGDSGGKSSTRR